MINYSLTQIIFISELFLLIKQSKCSERTNALSLRNWFIDLSSIFIKKAMSTLVWLVYVFAYSLSLKSNDNLLLKSTPDPTELNFIRLMSTKSTILLSPIKKIYKFLHFNFVNGWIDVIKFSVSLNAFSVSMSIKTNASIE